MAKNNANPGWEWTEDRLRQLREWWAAGYSALSIAHAFGSPVTKNMVIGFVTRLNLPKRTTLSNDDITPRTTEDRPRFDELGPRQCKYPLGKLLEQSEYWCGHPVEPGKNYCPEHQAICYRSGT